MITDHRVTAEITPGVQSARTNAIERILANLLGNAAKYTPTGTSIVVRLQPGPEGDGEGAKVEDKGLGIPVEERDRIFLRYERFAAPPPGASPVRASASPSPSWPNSSSNSMRR